VRVPFKGAARPSTVLNGSTPIALIGEGNVIGQVRAGTMTPLVMVNNIKSPNFPMCRRWRRPATRERAVAAGTDCSRGRHAEAARRQARQGGRQHRR
jgi:hypothetical protein